MNSAAIAVMRADAEEIAQELLRMRRKEAALTDRLTAISEWWPPAPGASPKPFPLAPSTVKIIQSDRFAPWRPRHQSVMAAEHGKWRDYHARLLNDAEATRVVAKP